jgi:hypothetical protein
LEVQGSFACLRGREREESQSSIARFSHTTLKIEEEEEEEKQEENNNNYNNYNNKS